MVSFQCEACGDVFTKKKLDPHRNQCHGASFSCLDCMVHFQGTQYRSHTSCMTEAQKYQGALYKEKPSKAQKQHKTVTIAPHDRNGSKSRSSSVVPRAPYVEDAPDPDDVKGSRRPPPPAPSPPPPETPAPNSTAVAKSGKDVNVFDFLEPGETPNASKVSLGGSKEPMTMVDHAPSVFNPPKQLARLDKGAKDEEEPSYDVAFEENGFSYGAGPIPPSVYDNPVGNQSTEFVTPAPRRSREKSHRERHGSPGLNRNDSITSTGDKKRKRGHVDEIDPSVANASRFEDDTPMTDAPSSMIVNASTPALNHSGLTGGLGRMMRDYTPDYPDYHSDVDYDDDDRYQDPVSPIKRTRRADKESISSNNNSTDNGLGISIKGRTGRIMSLLGGTSGVTSIATVAVNNNDAASRTLVRTRRRSTEGIHVRKQKKHRVRQVESHKSKRRTSGSNAVPVGGGGSNGLHLDTDSDSQQPRRLKAIEYHRRSSHSDSEPRSRSPRNSKSRNTENQLVVYKRAGDDEDAAPLELVQKEKASGFLSLVTKGPDSERGISMHKALKRYHREFPALFSSLMDRDNNGSEGKERGRGRGRGKERGGSVDKDRKSDEEKDLWRALRLKRNDRGEIVVFI